MPYRHRKRWTRRERTIIAIPILASLILWLLPQAWTGRMIGAVQFLNPFHRAVNGSLSAIDQVVDSPAPKLSASDADQLLRHNQALEHQVTALSARIAALESEVDHLAGTRLFTVDGANLGPRGQLIPAVVVGEDFLPWRSSLLLTAGTSDGAQKGDPVTSRYFTIGLGADEGTRAGQSILLGEVLVGWIDQAGSHASRVKLCSDITAQMKVRIGRASGSGVRLVDGYYWLTGRGHGLMEIKGVERQLVEGQTSAIQVGDFVLSDPLNPSLPAALTIGTVEAIAADLHSPLLAIVSVRASLHDQSLDRVYIFDHAE